MVWFTQNATVSRLFCRFSSRRWPRAAVVEYSGPCEHHLSTGWSTHWQSERHLCCKQERPGSSPQLRYSVSHLVVSLLVL